LQGILFSYQGITVSVKEVYMWFRRTVIRLLVPLAAVLLSTEAVGQSRCSLPLIRSTYAVTCSGSAVTSLGIFPYSILGIVVGDRLGVFSSTGSQATMNVAGSVLPLLVRGQAKVNPDCTGSISYTILQPDGNPTLGRMDINFVVLDEGREMRGMVVGYTDPKTGRSAGPVPNVQCQLSLIARHSPEN
jgi:hypothetical protein